MLNLLSNVLAFMITAPFFITFTIYLIVKYFYQNKWRAIHVAVDSTTALYILSVGTIGYLLFSFNIFALIFIFLLCIWSLMVILQWRWHTEITFKLVWKRFWKISFLVFFTLNVIITFYGVVIYVFDTI